MREGNYILPGWIKNTGTLLEEWRNTPILLEVISGVRYACKMVLKAVGTIIPDVLVRETPSYHKLQLLLQEAETLARKDALTGLPNRLAMEEKVKQILASMERKMQEIKRAGGRIEHHHEESYAILYLDLDSLKVTNDTEAGHDAGDELLKSVAAALFSKVRGEEKGNFGRVGGDEFLGVFPLGKNNFESNVEAALSIGEHLRQAAESSGENSTVSIGIVIFDLWSFKKLSEDHGDISFKIFLAAADRAMYQAKNNGKNCCKLAEEDELRLLGIEADLDETIVDSPRR